MFTKLSYHCVKLLTALALLTMSWRCTKYRHISYIFIRFADNFSHKTLIEKLSFSDPNRKKNHHNLPKLKLKIFFVYSHFTLWQNTMYCSTSDKFLLLIGLWSNIKAVYFDSEKLIPYMWMKCLCLSPSGWLPWHLKLFILIWPIQSSIMIIMPFLKKINKF